jgi:phosphoribosyl 1,2-cyclic phosphodiesterase
VRATVWGCRGSLATPGEETLRYGGNTSCVELELADGTVVVLDAGTGARGLGLRLAADRPAVIHLLLTHLHLDHLEGLGFFRPLWTSGVELHVWGPASPVMSLRERVARYLSPPLFPMQLADVAAHVTFHDVPEEPWSIGSARFLAEPVLHPGATVGYRVEENGSSLTYIPDHEPAFGHDLDSRSPDWISGWELARDASVVIHDAQYTETEYEEKTGWGHSSVADAVAFARIAGARRLVLFHHDPMHSDDELERLRERAHELWDGNGSRPELAYEGMEIVLG